MDEQKVAELNRIIRECKHIVFFGGAGVSTESGIPDFRSTDGLYHQQSDDPPEEILSHITATLYTPRIRPSYPYDAYRLNTGIMIDLIRRELLPEM